MTVPADQKFSGFVDGGILVHNDIVVGLRDGINTRFSYQGDPGIYLPLAGGTMAGAIIMGSNAVTGLPAPTNPSDAATKAYVDATVGLYLPLAGGTMSGELDMGNNFIANTAGIEGANGNVVAKFIDAAATVNYFELHSGISTQTPFMDASGTDAAINFNLRTKNGDFWFSDKTTTKSPFLCWFNAAGTKYIGFRAPTALANTVNFTWPSTDGSSGFVMTTDGVGNLSFAATAAPASAALTKVDDTNVTLTLGGTPASALLQATSITAGWSGQLATGRGGTGLNGITAHNMLVGNGASAANLIAPSATSGVPLISQGAAADPVFGTAVVAGGGTGAATLTAHGILLGQGTSPVTALSLTNNQIIIGNTGADPSATTLTLLMDSVFGSAQGDLLYRNVSGWVVLAPGTNGQYLQTQGAAANPQWVTSATVTPAALTKGDDTNVTLTLGGTPATSLLQATSITAGWTGQLAVSRGGTGLAAVTAHYLPIGNGTSALTLLAPSATSGIPLVSQGAAADPAYSTAVVAGGGTGNTTFTAYSLICAGTTATGAFQNVSGVGALNQVLVSQGAGTLPIWASVPGLTPAALTKVDDTNVTLTLGGTPSTALLQAASLTLGWTGQLGLTRGGSGANLTAVNGAVVYSTASAMAFTAAGTSGQFFQSAGAASPVWATIPGILTTWSTITAATLSAAINNGYVINHAATACVITLPATAAVGSKVAIRGLSGSGGWTATANGGQTIQFGNTASSAAGSWTSTNGGDSCDIECIVANTTWTLTNCVSSGLIVS